MKKEKERFSCWEPDYLKIEEEESREKYSASYFDKNSDFGSYKALIEGVSKKSSAIEHHNLCNETRITQCLKDYVKILNRNDCNNPKTIADFGCGVGFTTRKLKKIFPESIVTGYDISHDAINYAKTASTNCLFEQKVIDPNIKSNNEQFDLILCQEFYPFTRTDRIEDHLKWLNYLLESITQNGKVIITVSAATPKSIKSTYKILKRNFNLKIWTLITPRISSRLPLSLALFFGKITLVIYPKLVRNIFVLSR